VNRPLDYQFRQTKELHKLAEALSVSPPKGNYAKYYKITDCIESSSFPWIPIIAGDNPSQIKLAKWGLVLKSKEDRVCFTSIHQSTNNWSTLPFMDNRAVIIAHGLYLNYYPDLRTNDKLRIHLMLKNGEDFFIPCIYRTWFADEVNAEAKTVSMLTRKANAFFAEIDNKNRMMPIILKQDKMLAYLNGKMDIAEFNEDSYFDNITFVKSRR
jgi:putative SOS response-associated peptidase YedK